MIVVGASGSDLYFVIWGGLILTNFMARPLRLEYPGDLYHVTSRGNAQADIFLCDEDRARFVQLLGDEVGQQQWICYAWCLMDNHYHFLVETTDANLSRGMQRLNGRYTQAFNRRHGRVGHVFQGRYKAILVEKEAHLFELCRYIVLNPVRAGMVGEADQWRWSSHNEVVGWQSGDSWLAVGVILGLFSSRVNEAKGKYARFVHDGIGHASPWVQLHGQVYLGGEEFLAASREKVSLLAVDRDISTDQQHPERPELERVLSDVADAYGINADEVLEKRSHRDAYQTAVFLLRRVCNMSLKDAAGLAGISIGRVSQIQALMRGKELPNGLENYKV